MMRTQYRLKNYFWAHTTYTLAIRFVRAGYKGSQHAHQLHGVLSGYERASIQIFDHSLTSPHRFTCVAEDTWRVVVIDMFIIDLSPHALVGHTG
jgi:hypothetical protein